MFLQNTEKLLEVDLVTNELTVQECDAITAAEKELMGDEWLNVESKKLVTNGLKISSGIYLLEQSVEFCGSQLTIRIKYEEKTIHTIWLESENPKIQASLIFACNELNIVKPSVNYDTIHKITINAVSRLSALEQDDVVNLSNAIYELANFTEY